MNIPDKEKGLPKKGKPSELELCLTRHNVIESRTIVNDSLLYVIYDSCAFGPSKSQRPRSRSDRCPFL